jgi:hypothetical protein
VDEIGRTTPARCLRRLVAGPQGLRNDSIT